jgi:hypothetical protein
MAVGAQSTDVIRLVLSQAAPMILSGIGAGALLAFAAGRLVGSWVPGVQPDAPLPYFAMVAVMMAAATSVPDGVKQLSQVFCEPPRLLEKPYRQ